MKKQKGNLFVRDTVGDKIILTINFIALCLFLIIIAYPLLFVISASFSAGTATMSLSLIPKRFSLAGYEAVLQYKDIWMGYRNSLFYMVCGTALCLAMTVLMAYPLSRSDFAGRKVIMLLAMVTMYFSGGLIPSYLLMGNLHLMNTYASMILPGLVGTYNMILIRNYFQSIPQDLEDACMIDGAGQFTTFYKIIIPVSTPILATVALWLAVGHWNSWFDVLLYMRNEERMTLQIILRRIVLEGTQQLLDMSSNSTLDDTQVVSSDGLKAATIYVATLPILLVYPFVQKYFVKGIMVGSLKG